MTRGDNSPVGMIPRGIWELAAVNPTLRLICLTAWILLSKAVASLLTVPSPPTQAMLKIEHNISMWIKHSEMDKFRISTSFLVKCTAQSQLPCKWHLNLEIQP